MRRHGTSWNTSEATEEIQAVLLWEVWRHLHQLNLFQELLASFNGSSQFLLQVNILLKCTDHKPENDVSYHCPKSKSLCEIMFKICSSHFATAADFRTGPPCSKIVEGCQGQRCQGNSRNRRKMQEPLLTLSQPNNSKGGLFAPPKRKQSHNPRSFSSSPHQLVKTNDQFAGKLLRCNVHEFAKPANSMMWFARI